MELAFMIGGNEQMRKIFKESCLQDGALFYHEVPSSDRIPKEVMDDINKALDEEYKNR